MKKTGTQLIADEREKQIAKFGYDVNHDSAVNSSFELSKVVSLLVRTDDEVSVIDLISPSLPQWDKSYLEVLDNKPYLDKLIIAGALIAAEIDRLQKVQLWRKKK